MQDQPQPAKDDKNLAAKPIEAKTQELKGKDFGSKDVEGKADFDITTGQRSSIGTTKPLSAELTAKIKPQMLVVGSNSSQFAIVDHVEGNSLRLTRDDKGEHHYLPLAWVASVDDKVHVDRTSEQAKREWTTKLS